MDCSIFEEDDYELLKFRNILKDGAWHAAEVLKPINITKDKEHFNNSSEAVKKMVIDIHMFFARGDSVVIDQITDYYPEHVKKSFCWQMYEAEKIVNEYVHAETYKKLLLIYRPDITNKDIIEYIDKNSYVQNKLKWCRDFIEKCKFKPEKYQLIYIMMIVEQLFFSTSFCSIFWLKSKGLFPCISEANDMISRDEGTHYQCGKYLFSCNKVNIDRSFIISTMEEAVKIEKEFCHKVTPNAIGMTVELMDQYIEFMADKILYDCIEYKHYNTNNPFTFMVQYGIEKKVDFFRKDNSEYSNFKQEPYTEIEYKYF